MNTHSSLNNSTESITSTFNLEVWGATDPGRVHPHNEDAIWPQGGGTPLPDGSYLLVVADGVGGSQVGDVASRIAIKEIVSYCQAVHLTDPVQVLHQAVQAANAAVYSYVLGAPTVRQAASTVVVALVKDGQVHIANVGDSRAYLIQDGMVEQLTQDHTLTQQKVDSGRLNPELAPYDEDRNIITRSLGSTPTVQVDINFNGVRTLHPGDAVLLCSDGLTDVLAERDIARLVGRRSPRQAVRRLITAANQRGGPDDISVVIGRMPDSTSFTTFSWPYLLLGFGVLLLLLACGLLLGGLWLRRSPDQAVTPVTSSLDGVEVVVESPTSTPVIPTTSATLVLSASPTPSPTPHLFATSTPLPTPTLTPLPPTPIPSPSPTPTNTPTLVPAPILIDPAENAPVFKGRETEFKWAWQENLVEGWGFELFTWREGDTQQYPVLKNDYERQKDGIYKARLLIDEIEAMSEPGNYYWTVVIVQLKPYQIIGTPAPARKLIYVEPGSD